jgi:hypothetical protein
MNDHQIVAAITTILEFAKKDWQPDVSTVADSYRENLRIASQPKDPNELTIREIDEFRDRVLAQKKKSGGAS